MSKLLLAAIATIGVVMQAGIACADAIDGDWCSADGMRLSINGEKITTPGGRHVQGNYSRHAIDYVVPPGESGSGEIMNVILRSEYLAVSRQGPADGRQREWRRCREGIS